MSTTSLRDPLASTVFSKARSAVLGLLYGHADEAFYLREIVERTGLGIGQVQREVKQLSEAGILRREARGRHVYFQADPTCPIFEELRSITTKTIGAAASLRRSLRSLRDRIAVAFVYGSVARGEEQHSSDLDLMVIGEVTFGEVTKVIRAAERQLHRSVNPTVYPVREFREKLLAGHQFLNAVVKGKRIFVIGDEHELGALPA
ncbi:MAG: nucleotidyltransferase domain-containing protein [Planctomycetes bacterium]|nr:nucleotidyltransferase domain-containing protein [Planctomycetota bacterium]